MVINFENFFLDPASGCFDDWTKSVAGVKYVYTLELRPNDRDWRGFVLVVDQLIPTGEEIWAGIQVIARRVKM